MPDVLGATHQGSGNFLLRNGFAKLVSQQGGECGRPATQIPFLDHDAVMADLQDRLHRLVPLSGRGEPIYPAESVAAVGENRCVKGKLDAGSTRGDLVKLTVRQLYEIFS